MIEFAEIYGERSAGFWSINEATNRASLEVLTAAHEVQRARQLQVPIHEYIARQKQQKVLVLGDYHGEGIARLEAIKASLKNLGYEPLLVKDIGDIPVIDLPSKVRILGNMARFVVVDDSTPSGHLYEVKLCKQNEWITVLLRANGIPASYMTAGAGITRQIIYEMAYDPAAPDSSLSESCSWAEAKRKEMQERFAETYPWYPHMPDDDV